MIRINDAKSENTLKSAVLASAFLLFAAATGFGQEQINLSAGPTTTTMPDSTVVPMWGYTCGAKVTGSTATCAPLSGSNPTTSAAASGALGGIYILNGGSGYTSAPTVTLSAPTGTIAGVTPVTATATAVVNGGQVVGFNVTSHGAGYTSAPTVTIGGPGTGAVAAASPAWSPVVITVPSGSGLTINLKNLLSFTPATSSTANTIPTSIVILGQVGGGLGGAPTVGGIGTPTATASPSHANAQGCVTWFIASGATPAGTPCPSPQPGASGAPPAQGPRVQSMATEVIVGSTTSLTWSGLKPGTYLIESGTHPSIQVPMGLIGMLVVTTAPSGSTAGTAYPVAGTSPSVRYNGEVPLEFSEIDPVQNREVDRDVRTAGFSETRVWTGMPTDPNTGLAGCGYPGSSAYHTCYPPVVNYTPFYFLINGLAFDKTLAAFSLFPATAGVSGSTPVTTGITGTILVRLVNAGLRMHVPSIVGSQTAGFTGAGVAATVSGFTIVAEDGNPIPNQRAPRVQTDVFMAAGKTFDVKVNVPASGSSALPIYDRELSLSANSSVRDAGMLAYIGVNGAALPVTPGLGVFAAALANPDTYSSVIPCLTGATSCTPLVISDPSKGVIANDVNVYGVALSTPPASGTLTCNALPSNPVDGICANGTFTYTPNPGWAADSFSYCANGAVAGTTGLCTTVALSATTLTGSPLANNITYTSKVATYLKIPSPGVLSVDSDPNRLPLSVALSSVSLPACSGTVTVLCGTMDANGGFTASAPNAGTYNFTYVAQNSQGTKSASATVTLIFPQPSNLTVNVVDAQVYNNCNLNSTCIAGLVPFADYRWIIEEDKTFSVDPNCTTNSSITTPGCPAVVGGVGTTGSTVPTFGVNFHTSSMDFVAQGCTGPLSCEGGQMFLNPATGTHDPAVCDVGNGACRFDTTGNGSTPVNPSQVHLDPSKHYYISVLPGDAGNPFPAYLGQPQCPANGAEAPASNLQCGHAMAGAPIPAACNVFGGPNGCTSASAFTKPVTVLTLPTPLPTGKLSVIVFEDDYPLNGEQDGGGGNGTVAPLEPGLGGFNLVLWDTYGGLGDVTGQDTNDMFNQSLSNSLAGTIDPSTGQDACPISAQATQDPTQAGITGMIVTCPKYEADGTTLSPLAGQAIIANLMPDKFSVQAYPGADRIARGEQWVQTNTLDGQHPHDSFIRIGEPSYFQEFGPAGFHVAIGFANPAIINARHTEVCNGFGSAGTVGPCDNTIDGQVDVERLSRTPDQRLYPSGSRAGFAWTQCWVSLGDPDGEDFEFTFCDAEGNFKFTNVPGGNWRLTIGDQWNDQIIDGLSTPANVGCVPVPPASTCTGGAQTLHMGAIGASQWQSNLYTRTFVDDNKDGIWEPNEIGIPFLYTRIRYRDGHNANSLLTDFNGIANFNETFRLFNWYVVEADSTRYKTTGVHTVYDAGGPADGTPYCGPGNGARACGTSTAYDFLVNTFETLPLPADLSVPGAVYCAAADCTTEAASFALGTAIPSSPTVSTGRIDPPTFGGTEGWDLLTGQSNYMDIGKAPYAACNPAQPVSATNFCATVTATAPGATSPTTTQVGENGGIYGIVQYASTRPFDDASQMIQQPWEPNIPHVTINLYQEGFAADGVTPTLTLVDTTQSSSWDDWAQGFYPNYTDPVTNTPLPYMSCPGQGTNVAGSPNQDLFYFSLFDQPNYLDWYDSLHNGGTLHALPYNSEFKCYDSMHIGNQGQPAPYDGKYSFPSALGISPVTGKLNTALTGGVGGNGPSTPGFTAGSMPGTNCTVCVANPDSTDKWRFGSPMLPPGKYVTEVIMPPGYEVYKEEDKNLLIGDNYIAPVTQEFGGLGTDIFIIPDQASVAGMYDQNANGFNPTNYQNSTTALDLQGGTLSGVPGYPGFQDPVWPCVGEMRVVPDFLSLFPNVQEVAPFAGATRPLCDRKEVVLANQMAVSVKFALFTSTHIAGKYTGGITDDFTSEFDPFSPQFGEKFAPPNMSISTRDYLGNELSRVYSDHWGTYEGMTYSSWAVNPPNITGYSPAMMVQCMNDPGPILDTNPSSPTFGQRITDPLFNPEYSDFCYEDPFMPGLETYLDTPVVPTSAFVGAGYNNPDCSYPDATPAVSEVDGDGIGPYVSAPGKTLTITSLGNQTTNDAAYSGPSANVAPYNQKTIGRHYGFGSVCTAPTAGSTTCNTASKITIGGVAATIVGWSDTQITATVPSGVPNCAIQQQKQYENLNGVPAQPIAQCGQLVITAGNGQQSIDTVTVTIGGKAPTHVSSTQTIQSAIDAAAPGDLIIVDPTCTTAGTTTSASCSAAALHSATPTQSAAAAAHVEMLLMWKPVRLQGVGAVSSVIDSNVFPAGKLLDPWRRHINCLFDLSLQGVPIGSGATPAVYDSTGAYNCPDTGWNYYISSADIPQVDRIPLEAVVGWDATLNGNLAEQLQEPSLMGAFEGAGVTVLGKGVFVPSGTSSFGIEGAFPTGALLLQNVPAALDETGATIPQEYAYCNTPTPGSTTELVPNPYPSNYECNPSSIDGLTITGSSAGGGGVFIHGWNHNLQVSNNRIYNNAGTLSGGVTVGQGEFPDPITITGVLNGQGEQSNLDVLPSCGNSNVLGTHLPNCLDVNVNVHNNDIYGNSSLGDELFSGTLAGGGGVSFCTGADYYKFNYNWICGNISSAEGGGVSHLGFMYNGDIEHNSIILNESTNPTIPTNGGGLIVMGTPDTDPTCIGIPDADCPPGLSDGTGPNLVINANLIQANAADSGAGGGLRLQQVNGTDISTFAHQPTRWNNVTVTNNIIVNNVAGWDGAGISLEDSLNVAIINNTIVSNDALATSGVLTQSIGTPQASAPAGNCVMAGPTGPSTASCPQSAGVTSEQNSPILTTTFTGLTITCPTGMPGCTGFSNPLLENNLIWQNRTFYIGIGNLGQGSLNQQKLISLFDAFTGTPAPVQTASGQCTPGVSYWDIGVRGDTGPSNHNSGFTLSPTYSALDDVTDYSGKNNLGVNPNVVSQYCNGSRVPPTCTVADGCGGPSGYGVPPGIVDASSPNPVFSLTPAATVDEGNNWINVSWGPLSLSDDSATGGLYGNYGGGAAFGNYALAASSPAIDYIPTTGGNFNTAAYPTLATDFFGNKRPDAPNTKFDIGAVEFQGTIPVPTLISLNPNTGLRNSTVVVTLTGTNLAGASAVNFSGTGVSAVVTGSTAGTVTATFTITAGAALGARNVSVTTAGGTSNIVTGAFTVVLPTLTSLAPTSGVQGTAVVVTLNGTGLTGATTVNFSGTGVSAVVTGSTATTVTATFNITATAATGTRSVSVTTPGGTTNILTGAFTVLPSTPTLTSLAPTSGAQGTTVVVTLNGTNLTGATTVNFSGTGVSAVVTGSTATTVTASFTVGPTAATGARNVSVTTPSGTSNILTGAFTVTPGTLTLTSLAPTSGAQGTAVVVTLNGTGLTGATAVNFSGAGVSAVVTGSTATTVTATFTITATAATGARNVSVTTPAGTTNTLTGAFTVLSSTTPTLTSLNPNTGRPASTVVVTLNGTNLAGATTVNFTGTGVSAVVTGSTATTVTATFTITAGAGLGTRGASVTTPAGTTNILNPAFTVVAPTLTTLAPNTGRPASTVIVTLSGTNLTGATAVNFTGTGVSAVVTGSTATTVTATFTITAGAALGTRGVSVTTPGGTTNLVNPAFTVVAPTLTSIAPATGTHGTTESVTFTGTNLTGATAVNFSGTGVSAAITGSTATTVTANVTITAGAALGARSVSVTTPGGTTNILTGAFTVN